MTRARLLRAVPLAAARRHERRASRRDHRHRALHAARERHRVDLVRARRGTQRRRPDPRLRRRLRCRRRSAPRSTTSSPATTSRTAASLRTMTRHDIYAMVAAKGAIEDSGLDLGEDPEARNALFTAGDKQVSDPDALRRVVGRGARRGRARPTSGGSASSRYSSVHPLFYLEGIQGASLFYISEQWGLQGANTYFSGTAEAGLLADRTRLPRRSPRGGRRGALRRLRLADLLVAHGGLGLLRRAHDPERARRRRLRAVRRGPRRRR